MSLQCTFDKVLAFVAARMSEFYDHDGPSYSPQLLALYKATVLAAIDNRRTGNTSNGLTLLLFAAQRWKSHPDFDPAWQRRDSVVTPPRRHEPRES